MISLMGNLPFKKYLEEKLLIDTVIMVTDGSSYKSRALPPFMKDKPYERYEVIKEFEVKSGEVAPWFGEQGKGMQYYTDFQIKDKYGNYVDASIENLIRFEYLKKID